MTQKVGGVKVGRFLQTALANHRGELVIPAVVTGTLSQPRFTPDAARVAEMKLKRLLPTEANSAGVLGGLANPKAAGRSVLDALRGRDGGADESGDETRAETRRDKAGPASRPRGRAFSASSTPSARRSRISSFAVPALAKVPPPEGGLRLPANPGIIHHKRFPRHVASGG
jgi:hypothetical protein